jgi:hypothetical protein
MLKILLIAIPVILVIFLVIIAMRPSEFRVTRSLSMNASPDMIFAQVNELKKWEAWNP